MEEAWIVVLSGKSGVPYYYGPFYDKAKADTFCERECTGFVAKVVELFVVDR